MTPLDEFMLREKIDRRLADADACLRRANASAATLEGCAREMAALFDEARRHIEALRANGWVGTKETAS